MSLTPEAREALNELATAVVMATGNRKVTQSDALRVAALLAKRHPDELADLYAQLGTPEA